MADSMIRLSDFRRFDSIASVRLTQSLLEGEDLIPGGANAAVLEAELYLNTSGEKPLARGQEVKYFHDNVSQGIFRVEESRQLSPTRYKIVAYDRMILLDREISGYWNSILPAYGWKAMQQLCDHLGVRDGTSNLPAEQLQPMDTGPFTGRQLLKWLGQRWGMWFRMDDVGKLTNGWVGGEPRPLGDYRMDGLTLADYKTAPVERVWVRQTEADVGAVYPDGLADTANTLILQGNPLAPDPQTLYEKLGGFSYRPFRCAVFGELPLGSLVTLPDGSVSPVLERTLENGVWTVSAPGNPGLQSTAAWNNLTFGQLQGRMLTVEKGLEGLRIQSQGGDGRITALELTAEGLNSRVEQLRLDTNTKAEASAVTSVRSQLTQRADSLEFSVTQLRTGLGDKADKDALEEVTERFRFDAEGLTITNSGTGMGIGISEQRVIFTGGQDPVTVITPNALETARLAVRSDLRLGSFSLFQRTNGNLSLRWTQV